MLTAINCSVHTRRFARSAGAWTFAAVFATSLLFGSVMPGCGGKNEESAGADAKKTAAGSPTKPASSINALAGAWYSADSTTMAGFELDKSGVLVGYFLEGMDLEPGDMDIKADMPERGQLRLRAGTPFGEIAELFEVALDRDTLSLKPVGAVDDIGPGVYTRLKGQTIAGAHQDRLARVRAEAQAKQAAEEAAYAKRLDAAAALMARPDLVIVSSGADGLALAIESMEASPDSPDYQGVAVLMARNGGIPLRHRFTLTSRLDPAIMTGMSSELGSVTLRFGEMLGPVGVPGAGDFTVPLTVLRDPSRPPLVAGRNGEIVLASDAEKHASLLAAYAQVEVENRRLADALLEPFGALARIEVRYRNGEIGYLWAIVDETGGAVRVSGAHPNIQVRLNPARSDFSTPLTATLSTTGEMFLKGPGSTQLVATEVSGSAGFAGRVSQTIDADFRILRSYSAADIDRLKAACDSLYGQVSTPGAVMSGYAAQAVTSDNLPWAPFDIVMAPSRDLATLRMHGPDGVQKQYPFTRTETILGHRLAFKPPPSAEYVERERYNCTIDIAPGDDDAPRIVGTYKGFQTDLFRVTQEGSARIVLSPAATETDFEAAADALRNGLTLRVTHSAERTPQSGWPLTHLRLEGDAVVGHIDEGGARNHAGPAELTGQLLISQGQVMLVLQRTAITTTRPNIPPTSYALWMRRIDGEWQLAGAAMSPGSNPPTPRRLAFIASETGE